jgi:hypothetical protein
MTKAQAMGHRGKPNALPNHVIESKAESLHGPARIGRVTFTKSGKGIYFKGRGFYRISGFKANYAEARSHDPYWISGPRRDGRDRLYCPSGLPVEIDDDVREEVLARDPQETGIRIAR